MIQRVLGFETRLLSRLPGSCEGHRCNWDDLNHASFSITLTGFPGFVCLFFFTPNLDLRFRGKKRSKINTFHLSSAGNIEDTFSSFFSCIFRGVVRVRWTFGAMTWQPWTPENTWPDSESLSNQVYFSCSLMHRRFFFLSHHENCSQTVTWG